MYDYLRETVCRDEALISQMRSRLDETCWPDQECGILASDIAATVSGYLTIAEQNDRQNTRSTERFFAGLSARDWAKLLADERVFLPGDMEMLQR